MKRSGKNSLSLLLFSLMLIGSYTVPVSANEETGAVSSSSYVTTAETEQSENETTVSDESVASSESKTESSMTLESSQSTINTVETDEVKDSVKLNEKTVSDYGQDVKPYEQRVYKKNWKIWNQPYVSGAKDVDNTTRLFDQVVRVIREGRSGDTDYVLISEKINNQWQTVGWLNKNGVGETDPLYSKDGQLVQNTYKYIVKNNWTVWNEPYQSGAKSVANTTSYLNEKVLITRKAKRGNNIYVKIWVHRNGKYNYLGWFNESGLSNDIKEINKMSGELIPNTYGELTKNNWTIWENPYKPGTKALGNTSNYRNKQILFTRKAVTNYGTYYKMWAHSNGQYRYIGWIKDSGTTLIDRVEYNKKVSVPMQRVSKNNWTLWDRPYVYGAKKKGKTNNYLNQNVQIVSESKTNYGTYYELKSYGKSIGWINSSGVSQLGNEYVVPLIWANQINTAGYAQSGCAACSAYTVLHSKNYAMNRSLPWFYNNLPLHHSNPDIGQIGDPYGNTPFRAVISPVGLNNFMRSLGANSQNVTGQSMAYVKSEIKKGNPVMFWGRVGLSDTSNSLTTHVMIFMGYKDGAYLVQDPAYGNMNMGRRWFSEDRVNHYLNVKGNKLVVVR